MTQQPKLSDVLMPEDVTNRPSRARLLAEGGTIRTEERRRDERPTWLMLGVVIGAIAVLAWDLWQAVEVAK